MKMIRTKLLYLWLVTCVLLMTVSSAFAVAGSSILYTEANLGNGLWQYDYTFNNTSTTESLYSVYFYFTQDTSFTGISLPVGWDGLVWDGNTWTTDFADTFSTGNSSDISAGDSLSGFSFTVDYQAGNIAYDAFFNEEIVVSGNTAPMVPIVPEPASPALFMIGGILLTGVCYLRKRRT